MHIQNNIGVSWTTWIQTWNVTQNNAQAVPILFLRIKQTELTT